MDQNPEPPRAEISNGVLRVELYLPDPGHGVYRGTRFDWSGVIGRLEYKQHNYYGPWFTKTDPNVHDFVFDGYDIVAGPCSAITGPVEEFSPLGFGDAKPSGTFIKIGIGALRKPDDNNYDHFRLYEVVNPGKWTAQRRQDTIEFEQDLIDPASGYAYRYTKIVRLTNGKPEMTLEHKLENTGSKKIETSVYDHNFLVLDKQPVGPDFVIKLPFVIQPRHVENPELAEITGHEFTYRRQLEGRETVSAEFSGFGNAPVDYKIVIENRKAGAGMRVTANRPLAKEYLWSIRSVLSVEPYIDISIEPGKAFTWSYDYIYYLLGETSR